MTAKIIGISGGTASGKTTLAKQVALLAGQQASTICLDSYYLPRDHQTPAERAKVNFDHPDSLDLNLLVRHLRALSAGESVEVPIYNFALHNRVPGGQVVEPRNLIIVEGILIFAGADLRDLFNYKVFVDAPNEVRYQRRLKRDIAERGRTAESVFEQWRTTVQPMFEEFCWPSRKYADLVVSGEGQLEKIAEELFRKVVTDK